EWSQFLASQEDLGTKSWPAQVFVMDELPRTATNKVRKNDLQALGVPERGARWIRTPRTQQYRVG
ncbi:MAG TPA: hypothetical protein PLO27_06045, partial [Marmoricola sp.]|nr:hypothetical protein [Marmoricola sp.]